MKWKILVIYNSKKEYFHFFDIIKKTGKYQIEIQNFTEFDSPDNEPRLREYISTELLIVVESVLYQKNYSKIQKKLKNAFPDLLPRVLEIVMEGTAAGRVVTNSKYIFYADTSAKKTILYYNLFSFIELIFREALLNYQLYDYLQSSVTEMVNSDLLLSKQKEIERLNKELDEKSKIDYLTSLYNRGAFFLYLKKDINRIKRQIWRMESSENGTIEKAKHKKSGSGPNGSIQDHIGRLSIMMIDIDHFKQVNDKYGHLFGDHVLRVLSEKLFHGNLLRSNDIASRYGGEEFIVILPETNEQNAKIAAEHLAENLKKIEFEPKDHKAFYVTVSIGISEYYSDDESENDLIDRADKALYWAKRNGRNRSVIFSDIS